ncbi:bifunctional 4-hydroxy-2-oxoglutarate aldolase/2-dehydro-3-deoxy-phosphogluconate aldolase [Aeromicrobium sp. 9AM]|uniref:bifunctional 4-hydroxy-2-oxoglutarate aldolase/2-dehydro-3-deoxy-phosphogluconate aldolase n=1 Tax=Aeromicrobium sp. 9AM TaxID=2653126 RepID=UPI0012F0BF71|nr:bifunctional 4-hydroxy-2-oxoglutarate aldolase/2-dehydro-3-deoxy-phosphogluconate aldolase [Aeromicrobium sp. 9AM]VXB34849.1 4-hydroxy-2-oxoglutarate aldolase / 2-dehydro-3-deoxy-phosphogluconate aldolase [Aeromicrobium sp. 9AM]
MSSVAEQLSQLRMVPVVVIDDPAAARPMAEALLAGGIGCAEITLRTPAGIEAIREAAKVDGFLVGAGTVLSPGQVDECVDAGARFIISPGLDSDVVAQARTREVAVIPGVATATEVQHALRLGLSLLKVFPVGALGGPKLLNALAAPFPDVRFVPSGGVSLANAADYLGVPSVAAISGSWLTPRSALAYGDFAEIERLARATASMLAAS